MSSQRKITMELVRATIRQIVSEKPPKTGMNKHILIRTCITAINNTVCVVVLMAVYLAKKLSLSRYVYGMAVLWFGLLYIVGKAFQDHKEGAIMTCPSMAFANSILLSVVV